MKTRIFSTILGSLFVFCLLTSVLCLLLTGCGGGKKGEEAPTTSTIKGVVLVPEATPTETAKANIFDFAKRILFKEAIAQATTKGLTGATVTVQRMGKDGNLQDVITTTATTDSNGNYTLSGIPKEDNFVVVAVKNVKDAGVDKVVIVKTFSSVEDADIGKVKENVNLDVTTTLAVSCVKDKIINLNQGKDEELKVTAGEIPKQEIEDIKTVIASKSADINEKSGVVDIVVRDDKNTDGNIDENDETLHDAEIKQIIEAYKNEIEGLRTELESKIATLEQKIQDLLSQGVIAGEIKDSAGDSLINVTVTVSGGGLTSPLTTNTSSEGQYVVRVPGSTTAYTVKATLSGYKDWTKTDVIVAAGTVVVVNITMSTAVDYSIYSGDWIFTLTITAGTIDVGEISTIGIKLNVSSDGSATFLVNQTYCGEMLVSGKFEGNKLTMSTNKDGWNCDGTICCTAQTTVTLTFSDKDNATGTFRGDSCCNSGWKEGSITLKRGIQPPPTTDTDKEQIKANFAAAVNAYNNKDINTLMSYFSQNYLDDGCDYNCEKADFEKEFADPNFKTVSYTINSITISGDKATMSITWGSGDTENIYWIKESGNWKMYGNQKKARVEVRTQNHNGTYFLDFRAAGKTITGGTVSGANISTTALTSDSGNEKWKALNGISSRPSIGDAYTFNLSYSDGTIGSLNTSVTGIVDSFSYIISPSNGSTVTTTTPTFSWTAATNIAYYSIYLADSQGNLIWYGHGIPSNTTSVVYNFDGDATQSLQSGQSYTWYIHTFDSNHNQGTASSATFIVQTSAKLKSQSNTQEGLVLQTYETVKLTYTTVKQKIVSTALSWWERIIG